MTRGGIIGKQARHAKLEECVKPIALIWNESPSQAQGMRLNLHDQSGKLVSAGFATPRAPPLVLAFRIIRTAYVSEPVIRIITVTFALVLEERN